jgi:plastocyanin
MSQRSLAAALALAAGLTASTAGAATTVVDLTVLNTFSPQTVTVRIGDTVTWNATSGFHNVFSDDGTSFTSGSAVLAPWTYSFTFTTASPTACPAAACSAPWSCWTRSSWRTAPT